MADFSYIGQKYRQGNSNLELITFCAEAADVYRWGGVPSKNERFHGGFQRALSKRYEKIVSYFNSGQTSPGSIVVAFREGVLNVTDLPMPNLWPVNALTTQPNFVHLAFGVDDDADLTLGELITRVRSLLERRPGFMIMAEDANNTEHLISDDDTEGADISAVTDSGEEDEDDLDVGQSKLMQFYDFIGDEEKVEKWISEEEKKIADLKAKKSLTKSEREYIRFSPREKIEETLKSLLRPAMIVDGQHRINGANEAEAESIHFTICAVKDADWVEQVFQFVVLNKMAKPISKDFLTELLNTSLTNTEINDIDSRLESIGIKNADRKIHKFVNHDPRSPFRDLVAEAGEVVGAERIGKLSQQGMLSLARRWKMISGPKKTREMDCFLPCINAGNLSEGRKKWEDYETWMPFFFAFWKVLRDKYSPQGIWVRKEKFHLLYIVTLQAMQDLFLEAKAGGKVKFTSPSDFENQVDDFFADVPATFFQNWSQTGLQSGDGWELIKKAIGMFQNGSQLTTVLKDSELFN